MTAKAQIAFLLNPAPAAHVCGASKRHSHGFHPYGRPQAPPMSPIQSAIIATTRDVRSPIASGTFFSSPLMLLGACIAPLEKVHVNAAKHSDCKKAAPKIAFNAMSDESVSSCCSSGVSDNDNDEDDNEEEDATSEIQEANDDDDEATSTSAPAASGASGKARKARTPPCQVDGCKNIAVSRGCCVRHGGGSRCTIAGCKNRAKLYKRCFQHGGFKTCSADGCTRKAKRYGHCWSHGGGRICEVPDCSKVSTQGGLCWAHGGGNRCRLEGCSRRSYQKYGYYCIDHASLHTNDGQQGPSAPTAQS